VSAVRLSVPTTLVRPVVVRDAAGGRYLELFLVSTVVAILGIRGYLELTGYPQIGGGGLHIAHMLWGGLLMLVALVLTLALLNQGAKRWAAIAGGAGFGTFIDELGKFITSDNDYFFRPTVGIIYIILIVLFLTFRWLGSARNLTPEERLVNAAAMLPELLLDGATPGEKERAIALLDQSGRQGPAPDAIRAAVHTVSEVGARPVRRGTVEDRLAAGLGWCRRQMDRFLASRLFPRLLMAVFVFSAIADVLVLLLVIGALLAARFIPDATLTIHLETMEAITAISSIVSAILTVIGVLRLRRSRAEALVFFRRALLVSIFFTDVFLFLQHELAALQNLAFDVLLLLAVDALQRRESPVHGR
jgi:hypothetical protein